jgi:hypothetical protein
MHVIEGWGNPSRIQNVMQKIGENNQKIGKTSPVVNQALVIEPRHDKIWAQWALGVLL